MKARRRLLSQAWVPRLLGMLMAGYLAFVHRTIRVVSEPANIDSSVSQIGTSIIATWHGQTWMVPFVQPKNYPVAVLVAPNREAAVVARAMERLGMGTIRASGSHNPGSSLRKRGVAGFREMLRALGEGTSIALTADVPKVARDAGKGIVLLAKHSGRPILPVAFVTRHALDFDSWDQFTVNLPFGRAGLVVGDPIWVPGDADEAALEGIRRAVSDSLDRATARAHELCGKASKFKREAVHG
jgi:lysophospholipid acyltransferase (LPLAT)-like uncharacterized protein